VKRASDPPEQSISQLRALQTNPPMQGAIGYALLASFKQSSTTAHPPCGSQNPSDAQYWVSRPPSQSSFVEHFPPLPGIRISSGGGSVVQSMTQLPDSHVMVPMHSAKG
jgi:hypothetical protein